MLRDVLRENYQEKLKRKTTSRQLYKLLDARTVKNLYMTQNVRIYRCYIPNAAKNSEPT